MHPHELQRDSKTGRLLWRDQVLLSEGLADVLDQMVQFHFSLRYQSAGEALDAIKNLSLTALIFFL
ncbi:MAG: hypothetical protein PUP92_07270 [Rhizonema sp. PD38]|nr:hypothetical protein [Rhizonema sp. PD38]